MLPLSQEMAAGPRQVGMLDKWRPERTWAKGDPDACVAPMSWLSSILGSIGPLPSPLKVSKEDEPDVAGSGSHYISPLAIAGRADSIDSWNTGSTDVSEHDPRLSTPSAATGRTPDRPDSIPELIPQRLDLEGLPPEDRGDVQIDFDPQHVKIERPNSARQRSDKVDDPARQGSEKVSVEETPTEEKRREHNEYSYKLVPKYLDFESWAKFINFGGEPILPTTWMVRNVPNTYTQHDLMAELDDLGFAGAFDFLYMPVDKSSKASVGYAFVNFIAPSWAARFAAHMQGHKFTRYGKNKEASVAVAYMQGLAANLAYYERCAVKSAKVANHRPLVLPATEVLPLPR